MPYFNISPSESKKFNLPKVIADTVSVVHSFVAGVIICLLQATSQDKTSEISHLNLIVGACSVIALFKNVIYPTITNFAKLNLSLAVQQLPFENYSIVTQTNRELE